jgi:hypothetical protein
MIALCARERVPESEAQLAVWIARNQLTWADFVSKGGAEGALITFGAASRILPHHGRGAAKLLISAGVNARYSEFFSDHAEGSFQKIAPAPEPEKTPESPSDAAP